MPSLILFRRRWRIGSDDFVFPGCFEAIVRAAWLILTLVLFLEHLNDSQKEDDNDSACPRGRILIRIYLIGVMTILTVTLLASVALVIHSAKGTIMHKAPRKHVPKILTLRVILGIFEIGWNILGTIWLYSDQVQCEKDSPLWILLEALVIFTWVALPVLVLTALLLFEPMMRPDTQESTLQHFRSSYILDRTNSGIGSHYIQLWERRCRVLCCTFAKDENSAEAFRNVADVLASVFEESDMVASDIAAALVLLRLKRKYEEAQEQGKLKFQDNISRHSHLENSSEASTPNLESPPPEWMTVESAHHYMKFALGSYGWPWYVYGRMFSASFALRNYLKCCVCCRSSLSHEREDNCCMCNIAALRTVTGLPQENIIYISFHNKIYECPFFVAIDDETHNVIIAIRGTLSLHDAITDLNAQSTLIACEGLPNDCRAHKGVVNAALYVRRKLEETNALNDAFSQRPAYGLILTGHSLGAGAAVVLAAMMKPQYPDLKCYAFSPPGGLCSMQMSKATEGFVMAVIVGNDLVPRLSLSAIHDLHKQIIDVLLKCRKPKYRILAKGCWYMIFGISDSSLLSSALEGNSQDQLLASDSGSYCYDSIQDIRIMFSEAPLRPVPRHTETLLFPPGRILYLKPRMGASDSGDDWDCQWADTNDFNQILISPNMLRHHLPQVVLAALTKVVQR